MKQLENFFTSGHEFDESQSDLKSKFQMFNIGILLSSFGLMFGIIGNIVRPSYAIIPFELFLILINIAIFFKLRRSDDSFSIVSKILTFNFTFLFLVLIYMYEPSDLRHTWLFTYPIILLFFQNIKSGFYWLTFMIFALFISPYQPFIETSYSLFQIIYLSIVLIIISIIMSFYKLKMDEARDVIIKQQNELKNFNIELETQVKFKTHELQELNDSLEVKVQEKIQELIDKDKLLTVQSKQAVMGEMITMIAHQWRQPLSTITLQISNINIKRLLGTDISVEENDKMLSEISDTIVYLSDTIDDFQTYFRPNKDKENIEIHEVLQRAINFTTPRLKEIEVEVINDKKQDVYASIYTSELIQVILNLLNNALDIIKEDKVQDAKILVYAEEDKKSIFIYVEDNASGISEDNLPHIFEPYFSTKGKNGTGLGLYMSQMIIQKQFHGNITVNTSKKGTTFIVEISK